jgi:single-strand DNA-binding protein
MPNLNSYIVVGHAGRDAELRYTQAGKPVVSVSVATSYKHGDKEETTWHNVTYWPHDEHFANYAAAIVKGQTVVAIGRLARRKYESKGIERESVDLIASVLATGPTAKASGPPAARLTTAAPANEWDQTGITDDDVPF